jgi:hypothetical protein
MLHLEKEISLLNLNKIELDSLALNLEDKGEYLSAVKERPLRKKARRNLTLRERTLTLYLDVRIPKPTNKDKDLEFSLYKEFKKLKIIRDILGFIIFKEHTKEEH